MFINFAGGSGRSSIKHQGRNAKSSKRLKELQVKKCPCPRSRRELTSEPVKVP